MLAAGYEGALHQAALTPLHRLWKRTVAPVWEQEPGARIYLVVLDGCSYPVFLELLHALSQDNTFPIGVRPDLDGRVGGLPAIAPLPTVTSHARGAIFLGELPQDPLVAETVFGDQDEAKTDKARLNQNAALGQRGRKLFLKGDLADGGQALLTALADPSLDVVAAVFNAVDDQIGSSNTGAAVRLSPEDITAFKPSLRGAIHARRRILVTADHGHSPYIEKGLRRSAGKTPRYLPLAKNAAVPAGFIEIDLVYAYARRQLAHHLVALDVPVNITRAADTHKMRAYLDEKYRAEMVEEKIISPQKTFLFVVEITSFCTGSSLVFLHAINTVENSRDKKHNRIDIELFFCKDTQISSLPYCAGIKDLAA